MVITCTNIKMQAAVLDPVRMQTIQPPPPPPPTPPPTTPMSKLNAYAEYPTITRANLKMEPTSAAASEPEHRNQFNQKMCSYHHHHVHRCFKLVLCNLVCAIPLAYAKLEFARAPSLNKQTNHYYLFHNQHSQLIGFILTWK